MRRTTLAVLALAAAGCESEPYGSHTDTTTSPPPPPPPAGGATVAVLNFRYNPAAVTVPVGGSVLWANVSNQVHDVVADGGAFQSGTLAAVAGGATGGTFTFTFTAPGTYPYHCAHHPQMTGTVTVTAAAGP